MTVLQTLLEKIENHTEHHYMILARDTGKMITNMVKNEDKKALFEQLLEDINHSYQIDPYHEDDHAIEKLEKLLLKIKKHLDSLSGNKINKAGKLFDIELDKNRVYNIFTKAGKYRWGKIYNAEKYFIILSGSTELTTFNWEEDIKTVVLAEQIVRIGPDVPNIFYFPEDTEMLEWFDRDASAEKYERYYNLKK